MIRYLFVSSHRSWWVDVNIDGLSDYEQLFMPIYDNQCGHWLLLVANLDATELRVYHSAPPPRKPGTKKHTPLLRGFHLVKSSWNLLGVRTCPRGNSTGQLARSGTIVGMIVEYLSWPLWICCRWMLMGFTSIKKMWNSCGTSAWQTYFREEFEISPMCSFMLDRIDVALQFWWGGCVTILWPLTEVKLWMSSANKIGCLTIFLLIVGEWCIEKHDKIIVIHFVKLHSQLVIL